MLSKALVYLSATPRTQRIFCLLLIPCWPILLICADEGYMTKGATTDKTDAAVQANIVAAKYVNPHFPGYKN